MFEHIGSRIRILARIICLAGFVVSGIAMIGIWITGGGLNGRGGFTIFFTGLLTGLLGGLIAWIMGTLAYGFGQLVEDAEAIRHCCEDTQYCADALRRMGEEQRRSGQRQRGGDD